MIPEFQELNEEEIDLMLKTPLLTSILVAGADDSIDKAELKEAITILNLNPKKARKEVREYYKHVSEDVEDKLKVIIHELPSSTSERSKLIISELERLNTVLPKLSKSFSIRFYESLKELAKKVAESSGGVFGFMSIGYEEAQVIDLKMIKDPSK